jgi:hypothetical protein
MGEKWTTTNPTDLPRSDHEGTKENADPRALRAARRYTPRKIGREALDFGIRHFIVIHFDSLIYTVEADSSLGTTSRLATDRSAGSLQYYIYSNSALILEVLAGFRV